MVLKTNVTTRSSYLLPFRISFCSSGTRRSIISDAANLCIKKNNDQPLPFFPSFLLVRRGRFLAMSNVFRREALALKPSICSVSTHLAASFRVLASLFGLRNASVRLNKYKPSKTVIARGFDADQLISCYAHFPSFFVSFPVPESGKLYSEEGTIGILADTLGRGRFASKDP